MKSLLARDDTCALVERKINIRRVLLPRQTDDIQRQPCIIRRVICFFSSPLSHKIDHTPSVRYPRINWRPTSCLRLSRMQMNNTCEFSLKMSIYLCIFSRRGWRTIAITSAYKFHSCGGGAVSSVSKVDAPVARSRRPRSRVAPR